MRSETYYLLTVIDDIEPMLSEAFRDEDDVLNAAKEHRATDPSLNDGLYMVTVNWASGAVSASSFSGYELLDD